MSRLLRCLLALIFCGCGSRATPTPPENPEPKSELMVRAEESERQGEALRAEQYWLAAWSEGEDLKVVLPPLLASSVRGGRLESALKYVERARRLEPDNPALLHVYAELLRALGREGRALEAVREQASSGSPLPETLFLLGTLERSHGDDDAAQSAWERYLEVAPEGPRALQVRALLGGAS